MISFTWLHRADVVRATVTHPSVWPWASFDGSLPEDYIVPQHAAFVEVTDNGNYLGAFGFEPVSHRCARGHIYLLPEARGRGAEICVGMLAWLAEMDQELAVVIGEIPEGNVKALHCIHKAGFVEVGRIPNAVTQRGKVQDLIVNCFVFEGR